MGLVSEDTMKIQPKSLVAIAHTLGQSPNEAEENPDSDVYMAVVETLLEIAYAMSHDSSAEGLSLVLDNVIRKWKD